jgi:hypothetical protein
VLFRSQGLPVVSAGLSFFLSPFLCAVLLAKARTQRSVYESLAKVLLLWSFTFWWVRLKVRFSQLSGA